MTSAPVRLVLAFVVLAFVQARSCGFTPVDGKGEGEPCTRSIECLLELECRAGVCARPLLDAGGDASSPIDASAPSDASIAPDADAIDAAADGSLLDAATDGSLIDAATDDAASDASLGDAGG